MSLRRLRRLRSVDKLNSAGLDHDALSSPGGRRPVAIAVAVAFTVVVVVVVVATPAFARTVTRASRGQSHIRRGCRSPLKAADLNRVGEQDDLGCKGVRGGGVDDDAVERRAGVHGLEKRAELVGGTDPQRLPNVPGIFNGLPPTCPPEPVGLFCVSLHAQRSPAILALAALRRRGGRDNCHSGVVLELKALRLFLCLRLLLRLCLRCLRQQQRETRTVGGSGDTDT